MIILQEKYSKLRTIRHGHERFLTQGTEFTVFRLHAKHAVQATERMMNHFEAALECIVFKACANLSSGLDFLMLVVGEGQEATNDFQRRRCWARTRGHDLDPPQNALPAPVFPNRAIGAVTRQYERQVRHAHHRGE